jgi:signal transduction histidine kinase/ActR/RegA family two-component response regulator
MTVVAIPLIALLASTSASLVLQRNESHERSVGRTAGALSTAAGQVLADTVNAETGLRGYAATRDPLFLAPYDLTLTRIGAERTALRKDAVAEGDGRLQFLVDASAGKVLVELAQLRRDIADGLSDRRLLAPLEAQKSTMDLLRGEVADLATGPAALQTEQRSKIETLQGTIDAADVATLILGLLAGLAGVALFTSGISRRVAANAANAARLGQGIPLEPVAKCSDEIGQVAEAHVRAEELINSRAVELTTARDEALMATRAKTTFLSATSHELRTPLNAILGFAQLLEMADLNEVDHDSATHIRLAGRFLLALINDLIDIAQIESGDLSLSLEVVPLPPLVENLTRLMGPLAVERSITIQHRSDPATLAVHADRQRLLQVLLNLISNAIKYNVRGGTVTIICEEAGTDRVRLTVADTGRGIAPEDLERIFMPFERLGAEQGTEEGSGIGLPLARALTEAMGGRLHASSERGTGSVFAVDLPRAAPATQVCAPRPAMAKDVGTHSPAGAIMNVLYIEDNAANVQLVARFVTGLPHVTLQSTSSGRTGIECATRDVPDLILLDLHLDDIHGSQVLNELKADPATAAIPVVILSAEADPRVARCLIASGALAYLKKPLDLGALGALFAGCAATVSAATV